MRRSRHSSRFFLIALFLFALPCRAANPHELIIWTEWNDPSRTAQFHEFEIEHPGWHIISSTSGDMIIQQQRLLCGVAGGDPPDVVLISRHTICDWATRQAFLPLDDFMRRSMDQQHLAEAVRDAVAANDQAAMDRNLNALRTALQPLGDSRQLAAVDDLQRWIMPGRKADADQLVSLCQGINQSEFYKAVWSEVVSNGQSYAVPTGYDNRALYYNEDLLEKAGLVDANGKAKPPKTWDELKDYALKLTTRDAKGNIRQLGFAPNYGNSWLYMYGWQNGGEFMSADGRTCTMDDPRIVQALQYMTDLYDSLGGIQQVESFQSSFESGGSAFDPFFTGHLAMKIDGSWQLSNLADLAPTMRFGLVPAPVPAGRTPISWSGGFALALPTGGRHADMAFELVRFLLSDRLIRLQNDLAMRYSMARGTTYLPMGNPKIAIDREMYETRVKNNPALPLRIRQAANVFLDLADKSRFRPVTPVGQLLWDEHVRAYNKAVYHSLTPLQALQHGRMVVQAELDAIYGSSATAPLVPWGWIWSVVGMLVLCILGVIYLMNGRRQLLRQLGSYESRTAYLFVSPWLFGLLVFAAGPMIVSIVFSFCRYDVLHPARFIGLENYRALFTHDELVGKALLNTGFMLLAVPLGVTLGLGIALLLNTEVRGMRIYRTIFYLPAIVPAVASSILWIWILNPKLGLLNTFLSLIGIAHPPEWLQSSDWLFGSKTGILLMMLWGAGGGMVIWLAGLKGIPTQLYEAAQIDGASTLRQLWNVTLPILSPYIFFNVIMGIIGTLQIFSQSFIMTQGGPDDSTMFYVYYLFNNAFAYFKMGYASALAWILFVIILVLSVAQMWLSKRWVHYDVE